MRSSNKTAVQCFADQVIFNSRLYFELQDKPHNYLDAMPLFHNSPSQAASAFNQ